MTQNETALQDNTGREHNFSSINGAIKLEEFLLMQVRSDNNEENLKSFCKIFLLKVFKYLWV